MIALAAPTRNELGWHKVVLTDQQGQVFQLNQFGNANPAIDTDGFFFQEEDAIQPGVASRALGYVY